MVGAPRHGYVPTRKGQRHLGADGRIVPAERVLVAPTWCGRPGREWLYALCDAEEARANTVSLPALPVDPARWGKDWLAAGRERSHGLDVHQTPFATREEAAKTGTKVRVSRTERHITVRYSGLRLRSGHCTYRTTCISRGRSGSGSLRAPLASSSFCGWSSDRRRRTSGK